MDGNPMNILYKHFGKESKKEQEMLSVANIFYLMGQDQENKKIGGKDNEIERIRKR